MATSTLSANPVTCGQIRDFVFKKLLPNRGDAIKVDEGYTSLDDNITEYEVLVGRSTNWEKFILQVNAAQSRLILTLETDPRNNLSYQNLFFELDSSIHDLRFWNLSPSEPLPPFESLEIRSTVHYSRTHYDRVCYLAALNVLNQLIAKDLEKPEATAGLTAGLGI